MKLKNTISEKITLDRNIDWLFEFTQDFTKRKKWDKQTLEIGFLDDHIELKKGAKVYTKSIEGIRMDTEYLTFDTPNEISIQMLNKSPVFKNFIGVWNYISIENDKTILKITYKFNLRFPYNIISKIVFQKTHKNILKKLEFLENYLLKLNNEECSKMGCKK
ncbi:hypothetical protein [uncultured Tenacibaculum sp.]|uniref:hypothetical protein n=1 Tax=uncultured Tenacibaculum sp. TaxID=174713 RepID=UPI002639D4DE|nr:hypothetical protein [uncultured Tenacibaculum sp.]